MKPKNLNKVQSTLKLWAKTWNCFYAYSAIYVDVFVYNKCSREWRGWKNIKARSYLITPGTLQNKWIFKIRNRRRSMAFDLNWLIISLGWPKIYKFSSLKWKGKFEILDESYWTFSARLFHENKKAPFL